MGTLIISVYKKHGAVLLEGEIQLKLFMKTKIKSFKILPHGYGTHFVLKIIIVVAVLV